MLFISYTTIVSLIAIKMVNSHSQMLFSIFNFLLLSISITSSNAYFAEDSLLEPVITTRMEKTTRLHFYFQDKLSGKSPTAVKIIDGIGSFGSTYMIDDALTEEVDPASKIIGRAQGMYSLAAQNDIVLLMVVNYVFTRGKYNGSSISILGRNHVLDDVREMPIVGGSGLFRLAKGFALAHTVWFDGKTGDASVEYNVTVIHF